MAADVFSVNAPQVLLLVDGKSLNDQYSVERVNVATGGKSLASAHIRAKLDTPQTDIVLQLSSSDIEIVVKPEGNGKEQVIFWGKPSGYNFDASDSEGRIFEVRQAQHHFGTFVEGMWEYNVKAGDHQLIEQDIVFNPTINYTSYTGKRIGNTRGLGVARGNMSDAHRLPLAGDANIFLDPASVFTQAARRYAVGSSEKSVDDANEAKPLASDQFWTLKEAVYYLCFTLNSRSANFGNPSRDDLKLLDESDSLLRDLRIPLGTFLPEALDLVLNPFNFGWRVEYIGRGSRKISVFRRGAGKERKLKLDKPGEFYSPKKTNISVCELGVGNQTLINEVEAYGDFKLFESTWELKKAWPADLDSLSQEELSESSPDWAAHPERHRVWRDWVLNEAGDYIRVRSDYRTPYDFSDVFGTPTVARRRRFYPCITLDKDRLPVGDNGYFVEYYDGADWRPIGGFEVLTGECGIRFSGPTPPEEIAMVADTKLRITASVYSDERLKYTSDRVNTSAQGDVVPVLLDASGQFHYRKIHADSRFFAEIGGSNYEHLQIDDTDAIKDFADTIRKSMDQLDVSATIVMPNLDGDPLDPGDVVTKLEGRNWDLDIRSSSARRYPQVTGITYDCREHRRIFALETFRDTSYR
jgi:hypothetical protein